MRCSPAPSSTSVYLPVSASLTLTHVCVTRAYAHMYWIVCMHVLCTHMWIQACTHMTLPVHGSTDCSQSVQNKLPVSLHGHSATLLFLPPTFAFPSCSYFTSPLCSFHRISTWCIISCLCFFWTQSSLLIDLLVHFTLGISRSNYCFVYSFWKIEINSLDPCLQHHM